MTWEIYNERVANKEGILVEYGGLAGLRTGSCSKRYIEHQNSSAQVAQFSGTSNSNNRYSVSKVVAQYTEDGRLHAVFERTEERGAEAEAGENSGGFSKKSEVRWLENLGGDDWLSSDAAVEIGWKGPSRVALSSFRRMVKRNCTKEEEV
nr:phytochrome B-like isoform X2 [Ipomoea trifida]